MNILFWNVRGLEDPTKRRMVRDIIQREQAQFVCLKETKIVDPNPTFFRQIGSTKISTWVINNARGRSGG